MLTGIPSQHKTVSLDQFTAKKISTDSVACHSPITPVDMIDNPIAKLIYLGQDSIEESIFHEMKLESNRLLSFKNRWPLIDLKPESLAAAGFFYLQREDRVQCPFCYVIIFNWTTGDKPLREHMRKSPKCPFLVGSDVGNIPLIPGKQNHMCLSNGLDNKHPCSSVTASYKPKHPRMADIKRRLLTFSGWPLSTPSPAELAECGLYYSGVADVVTCFFCGGTLGNWDPDDDPWVEHSKFFHDCSFLAVTKKPRHVASVIKNPADSEKKLYKNKEIEVLGTSSHNTCSDIIQQALDIFPDHLVLDALKKKKEISSLQELCDEILDMKQQSPQETTVAENKKFTSVNSTSTASNDAILCKLCMDRERGVVFQPCGHLISCWQCSNLISDCPVCRRPIMHKIKTYFS